MLWYHAPSLFNEDRFVTFEEHGGKIVLLLKEEDKTGEYSTKRMTTTTDRMHLKDMDQGLKDWQGGMVIQKALPFLDANAIEFILTGITSDELFDDVYV